MGTEWKLDDPGAEDALERKKRELATRLLRKRSSGATRPAIAPRPRDAGELPLSFAQEGLWLLDRLSGGGTAYNTQLPIRLEGDLDVAVLQRVLDEITRRHEILRTSLRERDGRPVQVVPQWSAVRLVQDDMRGRENPRQLLLDELDAPFDLARGPLLRARLVRVRDDRWVLLLTMHHVVFDGASAGVLFHELCQLYAAFSAGRTSPLPELSIQYGDYALWQRQWLGGDALERGLAYWRERLAGAATLDLHADRPGRVAFAHQGTVCSFQLSLELSEAIRELSRRQGATPFITMLAAFQLLLHRYSGQDDILVGSPVTLRREPALEPLIGYFVNMVVMRTDLSGDPTFRELIARVRETALGAVAHGEVPFDKVVQELQPQRDPTRNPLFQAAFTLERRSDASSQQALPGLQISVVSDTISGSRFDLEAFVEDQASGMILGFLGRPDLFEPETVERMLGHYRMLLEGIVTDPDRPIRDLPMLSADEHQRVVEAWNATARDYPRDASVPELFAAQCSRAPDAVALEFGERQLTYRELDTRANRLAHHLRTRGVVAGTPVAILMQRDVEQLVALLAVLKAGGVYVPLDPESPSARLALVLEDAAPSVILSEQALRDALPPYTVQLVCVDRDAEAIAAEPVYALRREVDGQSLAYVIYTSGSTGTPKGVAVSHRSIARLVCNTDYVQINPSDRVGQASVCTFDAATFEIWGAWLNGARLVGLARDEVLSPTRLAACLRERKVSVLFLTTALFNQVAREAPGAFAGLGTLLFGGQRVDPGVVRAVLSDHPPRRLLHVYGPTECTTYATWYQVERVEASDSTVPIGRPIANTTAYLLDTNQQPVPVGVPGELYVGGDGLAREYWRRPELTAEKFVPDPFSDVAGARLYRTGDFGKYRADGAIEFLGRRDDQMKLRGFRIELGEIESALRNDAATREAVVVVREDTPGDRRLVAYVVAEGEATVWELRQSVRERLPEYMVPSAFVLLEALPLTANGKVDVRALPEPEGERQVEQVYVAPRSAIEQQIAALWRELLRVDQVGIHDNFFDLGGHSLLVVRMGAKLRERLDREIQVVELFQFPTIESLARHLSGEVDEGALADEARARVSRRTGVADEEPIAIIGMAGRFPGADSVDALWENLRGGVESIKYSSAEELIAAGVDPALVRDPRYVPARGVLADADRFDAAFFGYAPREAELIDPQQRVFLECAWEALENAGHDPQASDVLVGVYAGASPNSYIGNLRSRPDLLASVEGLAVTLGSGADFLATRVSYKLDLRGPSLNVQTACSTSLVAVHAACRALLDHDCDLALAGGVSVQVPQGNGHVYIEEGIGSPDGHCRTFDAAAQGTVGGDGVAVVVLKRLSEALAAGNTIRAVIRGTAINNDGSTKVGYTAPSVEGQARAIALAHAAAGVEPDSISYVEAHGTGTALGDPIEVAALTRVFGGTSREKGSCALGALKSNVGHLDAAAGVAGLIKTVLCLEHGELVPSLHYRQANPEIDFDAGPFRVNTQLRAWPTEPGTPRRAGVSSFGLGGTNAHAVLEEAPSVALAESPPSDRWELLCLSAKTETALDATGGRLAAHLRAHPELDLADVAHTLRVGRTGFTHRRAVLCQSTAEAAERLLDPAGARGVATTRDRAVTFLFPGQGAQHPNMGRALYEREPMFRDVIDACAETLRAHLDVDLRTLLFADDAELDGTAVRLRRTALTQPALFVTEFALAKLWMSWGVEPRAMIGHSIGEYVAACLAGVFSLEDALMLVATRGRLMDALPAGAMLSVALPEDEVRSMLGAGLSVAAVNGPSLVVVSGPERLVSELATQLEHRDLGPRRLHTSHAFHSAMMDPIDTPFRECVQSVSLRAPRIPFVSNLTGTWITDEQAADPSYWADHLRQAVRFSAGLKTLFADPERVFLEVGPGRTLSALVRSHPQHSEQTVSVPSLPSARGSQDAQMFLLEALARLWVVGAAEGVVHRHDGEARRRIPLPAYPFERQRYWIDRGRLPASEPTVTPKRSDVGDWFYLPSWKRSALDHTSAPAEGRSWLLFAAPRGVGAQMANALRETGADVVCVTTGDDYAASRPDAFVIDPRRAEHYSRLLADLAAAGRSPDRIVHLWLADTETAEASATRLQRCQDLGFYSLVYLARALGLADRPDPVAVTVITSQVHDLTGSEPLCPEKATVLGPCRVIATEYPSILTRNVDVELGNDPGAPLSSQTLAALLAEASSDAPDPIVAYRGGHRWLQTVEPLPLPSPEGTPELLREQGVYLILGGLGGLGLTLAGYLAHSVGARIVLASRGGLPEETEWDTWLETHEIGDPTRQRIEAVRALRGVGCQVWTRRVDVADARALGALADEIEQAFGRLDGVLHAAGAEKSGELIEHLTRDSCERQFHAKLSGLVALADVLQDRKLDFCLLCSSLSSILSIGGFVAYGASHAFMDAFASREDRAGGTRWISVNWDNWNLHNVDPADLPPGFAEFLMSPAEGIDALGRVLSTNGLAQILVSTGDLPMRMERLASRQGDDLARSSLPGGTHPRPVLSSEYVPPRNPLEGTLVEIWERLLGIERIGVHDNFLELGGDSVLSIQVAARASRAGLKLTPKQTLEHQTIAELSEVATASIRPTESEEVSIGDAPLTPVQHWFFDRELCQPQHFNQAMILRVNQPLPQSILNQALEHLMLRHDALRLRFTGTAEARQQTIVAPDGIAPLRCLDLSMLEERLHTDRIEQLAVELQRSLDLERGPILRAAYLDLGSARPGRLLIVVHHLAMDAVSWPILLGDLQDGCEQLLRGEDIALPPSTTSFRRWSLRLDEYAQSDGIERELEHWRAVREAEFAPLPIDVPGGEDTAGAAETISTELDEEDTRALLEKAPRAYHTQINDLLLTALTRAFKSWTGRSELWIDVEGHGRGILDDVDLSRTVGWFTTLHPVRLTLPNGDDPATAIKSVKEQLRAVPDGGMNFGVLRYLSRQPAVAEALSGMPDPETVFLYLGRFDPVSSESRLFEPAPESPGPEQSERNPRRHRLEITAAVSQNRLRTSWRFSPGVHRHSTVQALASAFEASLRSLIAHCQSAPAGGRTPSDFPAARLSQAALDRLAASLERRADR